MKIGIVVAMDKELVQLKALLDHATVEKRGNRDFVTGRVGPCDVVLQKCGIGKVNAAIGAVEMIGNYSPDLIVSSGVAGGADTEMNVADVVVGTHYVYHDAYCGSDCLYGQVAGMPPSFAAPVALVQKALALEGCPIHAGLIASGDWFVDSREKMRGIVERFPMVKAVDMESAAIAQTCHVYGLPFVSFRIISDIPLKDNKAQQYFDFWARMAEGSFDVTRKFLFSIYNL